MRVIKPYGNTKTGVGDREEAVRKIHPNSFREDASEIEDFATSHPKLVLAQWISLIDKIITKPAEGDAPSLDQLNLREEVGAAAWDIIVSKNLLSAPPKRLKRLQREWWSKIHPYGRETGPTGVLDFRGRWFATFSKERLASKVDGTALANALYNHLYLNERRIGKDSPARRNGLIHARAKSIAHNVLKEPEAAISLQLPWAQDDIGQFTTEPDLMICIHQALRKYEGQRQARTRQAIGREMQRHYKQIFATDDGSVPGTMEAMRLHPGLFALHSAAKNRLKGLLQAPQAYWLKKFPGTTSELIGELADVWRNRKVADLVRLGKVIHYEATLRGETDSPANVVSNWPQSISASPYWSSDGQTRVKQNEAFVRVWRHTLSFASRTITNWADPKGEIDRDILGARQRERAVKDLDSEAFDLTAEVLFGQGAPLICGPNLESRRAVLNLGLTGLSRLRNAAFHFSGVSSFVDALESLGNQADAGALTAVHTLFNDDQIALAKRLSVDLTSVDTEFFLSQQQLDQFLANLEESDSSYNGLPEFQKVLARGQSAYFWRKVDMRLPPPATYRTTDDASIRCRHLMLKLLYERPYPTWLCGISSATLREMVDQYITRSTNEARRIAVNDKLIARATGRIKILDNDTIFDLFAMLQKATVSEARDQDRKPADARDLSKYLRDLELDLIAQAFQLFVETQNLDWLFSLDGRKRSEERQSKLPMIEPTSSFDNRKDWQAVLYFLLHLVPVDEVNKLSHQISRTSIRKAEHAEVAAPLLSILYLNERSHDAKFSGLEGSNGRGAFHPFFSDATVADSVLVADSAAAIVTKGSVRALREMLRFMPPENLFKSLASIPIKQDHLGRFQTLSSEIAKAQEVRSDLHEKWVNAERMLSESDLEQYRTCLAVISDYRGVSQHIKMNTHLNAYRLFIAALAKLVDFSGVWERDLYFVTLALIYQLGGNPNNVFLKKRGWYPIETGQIIEALRNLEENDVAHLMLERVTKLFGVNSFSGGQTKIKTRNDLAHFQVLRNDTVELTELVNRTRDLLSYDKKRANAVSKSMINLFRRFGLKLQWETKQGQLCRAHIEAKEIVHLGVSDMTEPRVSNEFVSLAKTLI